MLRDASGVTVAVVGPITQDVALTIDGLPEAGGSTVASELFREPGGKGANPAIACLRLGARVRLLGAVGDDALGRRLLRELAADGLEVDAVRRWPEARTGYIVHLVQPDGGRRFVEFRGANGRLTWTAEEVADACRGCRVALVSTALGSDTVRAAVAGARAARALVIVDLAGPAETNRAVLAPADVVRGDATEVEALTGLAINGFESAARAARSLIDAGASGLVVVQAGSEGELYRRGSDELRVPRVPAQTIDPTGAGDALVATLAVLLGEGAPLERAAALASAAAAHTAARLGGRPAFASRRELEAMLG